MKRISIIAALTAAMLLSACDFWPKDLEPLANSIAQQVDGETTAWLLGGDVLIITVESSPLYQQSQATLEARATDIAGQAVGYSTEPLDSIAITFHEGRVSEDPNRMREFVYLVAENRPVLQPFLNVDASGPLTVEEIETLLLDQMGDTLEEGQRECLLIQVEQLAAIAGDPETLDPQSNEFLSADTWNLLDAFGRRLILAQAITTQAMFACV